MAGRRSFFSPHARTGYHSAIESNKAEATTGREYIWSPGCFSANLAEGSSASLVISTEKWDHVTPSIQRTLCSRNRTAATLAARCPEEARSGIAAEVVLAADQFLISPVGRAADTVQARPMAMKIRTVIAGYHWFTNWGRDTMISLEGLTIATGRTREGEYILRSFADCITRWLDSQYVSQRKDSGLATLRREPFVLYHAATAIFVQPTTVTGRLLPRLLDVVEWHPEGTSFGIGVQMPLTACFIRARPACSSHGWMRKSKIGS